MPLLHNDKTFHAFKGLNSEMNPCLLMYLTLRLLIVFVMLISLIFKKTTILSRIMQRVCVGKSYTVDVLK